MNVLDVLENLGDDSDNHAICPDCNGMGYVEESTYGPCPRCGRARYVPIDSLTEEERVAYLTLLEDNPEGYWVL